VTSDQIYILHEDNHLLFVNKPAGLLTQDSGTGEENLEDLAKDYIAVSRNKPGNVYLHAVHRLDRQVSGIVLFALSSKALSRLQAAMRDQTISKTYQAIVDVPLTPESGTLTGYMLHRSHFAEVLKKPREGAKKAMLNYEMIKASSRSYLVEVDLVTGRYHQIRAQLADAGSPILGDDRYGSRREFICPGIALHHRRMTLTHPTTKETLTIEARYPERWPLRD
jgi:23S rRNA pseudouridine1911/1915/1917 synthase